jgi:hypothetical protein
MLATGAPNISRAFRALRSTAERGVSAEQIWLRETRVRRQHCAPEVIEKIRVSGLEMAVTDLEISDGDR